MQRINLYQDHVRRRRDWLDAGHVALALTLGAVALAAVSGAQAWRAAELEARAAALAADRGVATGRLADLRARMEANRADGAGRHDGMRAELTAKRRLLDYLEDGPLARRTGFADHLGGLAERPVEGVWLRTISMREGGAHLRLEGHAVDAGRVPALIATLSEVPAFAGLAFRRLAIRRPAEADWRVDFVLASSPTTLGDDG